MNRIKDTIREEREEIVRRALSYCGGEKEISEINAEFSGGFVRG